MNLTFLFLKHLTTRNSAIVLNWIGCLALLVAVAWGESSWAAGVKAVNPQLAYRLQRDFGPQSLARVADWQNLIDRNQWQSEQEKIALVNRFFNRIPFVEDSAHWGLADYWATPLELLASNGGDCEDFAIAKYFTLRALELPVERLRLVYVNALELNRAHMVLTYSQDQQSEPLVLDNLKDEILPASRRTDLEPVYSFNAEGLWLAKQRGEVSHLGSGDDVTMWRELRLRVVTERVLAQE